MKARIKRDRVLFTCPNCTTRVYSRPDNKLVCGQCFIPLEPQLPPHYPQPKEQVRTNPTQTPPAELPLEDLALPPHIRELLNSITGSTPSPAELSVVQQWAPEQKQEPKKKKPLSDSELAKADLIIKAGLKADAESGAKRSGWKKNLAETIGRDPAWVSNRIKKVQPEDQPVPA